MNNNSPLDFDSWYAIHEDDINIELAKLGTYRELDFNPELEFDNRYEKYLKIFE